MRGERARCDEISSCQKLLLSAVSYPKAVRAGLEIEGQQVATFELILQENIKSLPHYPLPGLHLDICRNWAQGLMMCHWILQWIHGRAAPPGASYWQSIIRGHNTFSLVSQALIVIQVPE